MRVVLTLILIVTKVISNNDEARDNEVDVCSNFPSYENYTKNTTQNCGCETCVRKCCQRGFYLQHYEDPYENVFESICVRKDSESFVVPIYDRREFVFNLTLNDNFLIGMLNCENEDWQYFKMNNSDIREKYYIQKNGSLYYPYSKYKFYDNSRYCIDEEDGLSVFLCYTPQSPSKNVERVINSVGLIISMPFLLLTFLVFAMVPNASVHRKALMCYCLTLFLAYGFLVTVQLSTGAFKPVICHTIGYSIIFFFMASFFWMNVMCFDTWFAFGGLINFTREANSEKKRFIMYCLYAWGFPIIHITAIFLLNTFTDPNSTYYPGVGRTKCFLDDNPRTSFTYFYGPVAVLIGLNIFLFILTTIKISKIKKTPTSVRKWTNKRRSYEYDKRKFHLYLKLLLIMGINWSLEIVSWAVQYGQAARNSNSGVFFIWYISDFCNAIYGLIIFLLFVYKKTVWKTFKKKLVVLICPCWSKSYEVEDLKKSEQESISRTTSVTSDRTQSFKKSISEI